MGDALGVKKGLYTHSLGFMEVNKIDKHLLVLTQ